MRLPGIRVLREPVGARDLILIDDILATTPDRAIFDCARVLPLAEASALLDRALQQRWTTLESFSARVRRHRRRHGVGQLRRLAGEAAGGARSAAERRLLRILRQAGISVWTVNCAAHDAAGLIGVLDVAFQAARLAIEIDGLAWHVDAERFQRDRSRQNRLVNAGWTVLRFTWADLTDDPAGVVATIRLALVRAAA